jgi:hypothetical protein
MFPLEAETGCCLIVSAEADEVFRQQTVRQKVRKWAAFPEFNLLFAVSLRTLHLVHVAV